MFRHQILNEHNEATDFHHTKHLEQNRNGNGSKTSSYLTTQCDFFMNVWLYLTCPVDHRAQGWWAVRTQLPGSLSWWCGHCSCGQICCGRCGPQCSHCSGTPVIMLRKFCWKNFLTENITLSVVNEYTSATAMCVFLHMQKTQMFVFWQDTWVTKRTSGGFTG